MLISQWDDQFAVRCCKNIDRIFIDHLVHIHFMQDLPLAFIQYRSVRVSNSNFVTGRYESMEFVEVFIIQFFHRGKRCDVRMVATHFSIQPSNTGIARGDRIPDHIVEDMRHFETQLIDKSILLYSTDQVYRTISVVEDSGFWIL